MVEILCFSVAGSPLFPSRVYGARRRSGDPLGFCGTALVYSLDILRAFWFPVWPLR